MGLYGQERCIFNDHVANPFYLTKCHNPLVEKDTVEAKFCNECKKATFHEKDDPKMRWALNQINSKEHKAVKNLILKMIEGKVNINQLEKLYKEG